MMTVVDAAQDGAGRRSERRLRTLKAARIAFNLGRSVFDCTVRNLSPSGALLEVASTVGIPLRFEILMDQGGKRRTCSVRWKTQRLVGVHFDNIAQKAV
jgi:hypothetical protein